MLDDGLTNQLKQLIDSAKTIFVMFPQYATVDQKAVAASLYLSLVRADKSALLVTPQPLSDEDREELSGLEFAQQQLGNQNLSISFPYSPEQVDKVSYHIGEETKRFFLSVKPKPGVPPLDSNQVEFSYTGAAADALILVGLKELEDLEQLYFGYEQLYTDTPSISINSYTTSFGTYKLDGGTASCSSELATLLIKQLGLPLDNDTATNLLYGIESCTKNLSAATTTAETFDAVAQLLRSGARRTSKRKNNGGDTNLENGTESLVQQTSLNLGVEEENDELPEPKKVPGTEKKRNTTKKSTKNSAEPPPDYVPKKLM